MMEVSIVVGVKQRNFVKILSEIIIVIVIIMFDIIVLQLVLKFIVVFENDFIRQFIWEVKDKQMN